MAKTVTFLQLSPEFGGTKFGPFDGVEIRLGSDPAHSDITLPESLGVIPQHLKVLRQQDDSFILAPIDRAAATYHFRGGKGAAKLVTAPTAIKGGDAFALVTPEGPRFNLIVEDDPRAIAEAAREADGPGWRPGVNPTNLQRGLLAEIRRRGFAAVVTTGIGNTAQRWYSMIKTGQIFKPIYIVGGMMVVSGWLFAGTATCGAVRFNKQKSGVTEDLSNCKDQLSVSRGSGEGGAGDPTIPDLTSRVLGDPDWKQTMEADAELMEAYRAQLKAVLSQQSKYTWVYRQPGSPYTQFKGALEAAGLPATLVRALSFATATPNYQREWALVTDSEGEEVCGRGPISLTYRQARNLGLAAEPDALVERQVAESGDIVEQRVALDRTLRAAGAEYEYRDDLISSQGAEIQGGMQCLYVDGDDERVDAKAIAAALRRRIGASQTTTLPDEGEFYWIAARLVMLYAQDFKPVGLEPLTFNARAAPSVQMATLDVKDSRRSFAVRSAARLMARATAIPCFARFDLETTDMPEWFMQEPPMLGNCAILKAYVEYNRL